MSKQRGRSREREVGDLERGKGPQRDWKGGGGEPGGLGGRAPVRWRGWQEEERCSDSWPGLLVLNGRRGFLQGCGAKCRAEERL